MPDDNNAEAESNEEPLSPPKDDKRAAKKAAKRAKLEAELLARRLKAEEKQRKKDEKKRLKKGHMFTDEYFERQLQQIREIRLSERKFYQKVTDLYATAFDYLYASVYKNVKKE